MRNLDETDLSILRLLQQDGRITNADIARKVGLSPPSALQRVRALEQSGVLKGYMALVDYEKLGLKIMAITHITLALHQEQPIERFRRSVQEIEEILECYHVSGEYDFVLKIVVRDLRAYEKLIREKLSKIRGIAKISTSFVLGAPKVANTVPY